MPELTQQNIDDLADEARALCPSPKLAELDADIKGLAHHSLRSQARFLEGVIEAFEAPTLAKYQPEPLKVANGHDGGVKKADSTNPWSAAAWNATEQGRLVRALGEAKAASMAKSAGCVIGSTKPNPLYN